MVKQPKTTQKELNISQQDPSGRQQVMMLLILAVMIVLLALIFIGGPTWPVVLAVIINLTVLALVVNNSPELLPSILREICRILHS